jgi:hypothetical protein
MTPTICIASRKAPLVPHAGQAGAQGHQGLAFWDNGFKSFSANTPIKTPADLKGKKLRIQSSKVLEEQIRCGRRFAAGDGLL